MEIFDGKQLERERKALDLSPEQLAKLAGLKGGRSHVRRIERGLVHPRLETQRRLKVALEGAKEVPGQLWR